MRKLLIIFLFCICFINTAVSNNTNGKIDSVFISFNQKIITDTNAGKNFSDSLLLYKSNDTIILLKNKIKLSVLVNGVTVPGNYTGGKREDYYFAAFESNGAKIFVKTVTVHTAGFFEERLIHIVVVATVISIVLFYFIRNNRRRETITTKVERRSDGREVVDKLHALGYFKFAAHESVEDLKNDLIDSINNLNILSTIENEDTLEPLDYRLYFCDGEDLYEEGGLISNLERIAAAFKKRGLTFLWADEKYETETEASYHRITLNGKVYTSVYKNKDVNDSWGLAAKYFYFMLDEQLKIQGSEENIYPVSSGNDGQFMILTKQQFAYISSIGLDKAWQPRELKVWIHENKL